MKEKILMAEDEKELARAVKTILEFNDYDVTVVYNGEDAVNKTHEDNYDLILLDVMMPIMDGMTALKDIRKSGVNTPIIMLTAKSTIDDKVEGLDNGANDYLTKPYDKKELLARIRAQIRVHNKERERFRIGNITFNKEDSELLGEKSSFKLNEKECDLMEILINNQNRKINANEVAAKVWQSDEVSQEAVNMYVSYLPYLLYLAYFRKN